MFDPILDVAPLATWLRILLAGALLLLAFVFLSHALLRHKAKDERWQGPLSPRWFETMLRWGLATLLLGGGVTAWELGAGPLTWLGLSLLGMLVLAAEGASRARYGSPPRS